MKITNRKALLTLMALVLVDATPSLLSPGLRAENNTSTYYTNGLVNIVAGDVVVGNNGTNNYLLISNGTKLTNSGEGVVSYSSPAYNNLAVVSGSGSAWNVGSWFFIGRNDGSGGQLIITNGGSAFSPIGGYLGYYYSVSTNNSVLVTGPGSSWTLGPYGLYVGASGSSNTLTVANGGVVSNMSGTIVGQGAYAVDNRIVVTGSGSTFLNQGGDFTFNSTNNSLMVADGGRVISANFRVYVGVNDQIIITNGGYARVGGVTLSEAAGSFGNTAIVTGNGSVLTNTGHMSVGYSYGNSNALRVSNGGRVDSASASLGMYNGASYNQAVVDGIGSVWKNGGDFTLGGAGHDNRVVVTNGGLLIPTQITFGNTASGVSNSLLVTGAGSVISNTGTLYLGYYGAYSKTTVENGGRLFVGGAGVMGYVGASSSNNTVIVRGAGSLWTNVGDISVGFAGTGNQLLVSDGGLVVTPADLYLGRGASTGNSMVVSNGGQVVVGGYTRVGYGSGGGSGSGDVLVTGPGSVLQANHLGVGSNSFSLGRGSITVQDGGTIEVSTEIQDGRNGSGQITNSGGVIQWTTSSPNITTSSPNSIVVIDGTISYRNVASANISNAEISKMTFFGNNTFRLLSSSNATGLASYNFDSVANTGNAANYQRLALVGDNATWRSTRLTLGTGGALLVSNSASAVIAAAVNSTGSIYVVNSKVTYASNVVVNGSYISDPSTNTFLQNLTVTSSGSLAGGYGDVFDFKKSFYNQSTNSAAFNLTASTVTFSGGRIHTNSVAGADVGHDATHGYANGFTTTNFGYYRLTLGSASDSVYFTGGNGASSNALYITFLDVAGLTNSFAGVTDMITNLFHSAPSVNVYYASTNVVGLNSFLNDQVFQLSDLGGGLGGFLMPAVPEPSALMLSTIMLGLLIRRKSSGE